TTGGGGANVKANDRGTYALRAARHSDAMTETRAAAMRTTVRSGRNCPTPATTATAIRIPASTATRAMVATGAAARFVGSSWRSASTSRRRSSRESKIRIVASSCAASRPCSGAGQSFMPEVCAGRGLGKPRSGAAEQRQRAILNDHLGARPDGALRGARPRRERNLPPRPEPPRRERERDGLGMGVQEEQEGVVHDLLAVRGAGGDL